MLKKEEEITLQSILLLGLSVSNSNFTFSCCEVLYPSERRGHVSRVVNNVNVLTYRAERTYYGNVYCTYMCHTEVLVIQYIYNQFINKQKQ